MARSAELEDPERLSRTAFVGNVPAKTSRKELKKLFKQYGAVENVRLRGVIAANPKLPKKSALLARRMHKDCDTLLAYVVFKRDAREGAEGSGEGAEAEDGGSDDDEDENEDDNEDGDEDEDEDEDDDDDDDESDSDSDDGAIAAEKAKPEGVVMAGTKPSGADASDYSQPTAEVRAACAGLNLTIIHDKHLRVTPAMHTRSPVRQSVFVGNLPFDVTEEELILLFKDAAKDAGSKLVGVRVTRDKETGMGRGVGFVSFDDALGVRAVINQAGELKVRGRVIRMEAAAKERKRSSKAFKKQAKREAHRGAKPESRLGGGRPDKKRRRDVQTGERETRKDRKDKSAKKSIVKVKHAARKARQAAAADGKTMGGTGKN